MSAYAFGSHAGSDGEATNASHDAGGPVGFGLYEDETPAIRAGRTQTIAAPLSHGSSPNSNMAGRRREDDENLVVAGPLGGGNDGIGRRSEDDPNLVAQGVAFRGREGGIAAELSELAPSMRSGQGSASRGSHALVGASVRRLMPIECERLQALPDGWTDPNGDAPDSRRYAALGDAVTSSVAEWIGRRMISA